MHSIYSGCALIKKRLAVRLYLRGKILRLTQKGAVACTGLAAENPSISKYTDRASYMFLNERGMFSSLRIQCVFRCVNRKREID